MEPGAGDTDRNALRYQFSLVDFHGVLLLSVKCVQNPVCGSVLNQVAHAMLFGPQVK